MHNKILFLLIITSSLITYAGAENDVTFSSHSKPPVIHKIFGLNFSPYKDRQSPNLGSVIDERQLFERMKIIQPYTKWVRTYGCLNGLEKSGSVAHGLGLKIALGAWIGSDSNANAHEIKNLVSVAKAGEADMLIVGSEVLLRDDLSEADLISYINRIKQEVPELIVSYADVYSVLLFHPNVIDAVDVVLVNYYPYLDGIRLDLATAALNSQHERLLAAANGKKVMVSETGWPTKGNQIGQAVPSTKNAALYFLNFVSWADINSVEYFYFEAFDEKWKIYDEGPQGAHWGVWDKNGNLKPGMKTVFKGEFHEVGKGHINTPGGPGEPIIEFTFVPPLGSFKNLEGQVWHANPPDNKVIVYTYVSGWWIKPTFANPRTAIQPDGSWSTDITTGGIDKKATKITAFLIPNSYKPPLVFGDKALPEDLSRNALAKIEVNRNQ